MNTDTLISLLVSSATPVIQPVVWRRFALSLSCAAFASGLLVVFGYGLRPDLALMTTIPLFWAKLAFPTALAWLTLVVTARMSFPGLHVGDIAVLLIAPVAVVAIWGVMLLLSAPSDERVSLVLGRTWRTCALNITFLSFPGFVAFAKTVQSFAPTRLRLAGAAIGLLSGTIGAVAYCLHCPEMSPAFWSIWYVLGMSISAGLGALIGPRILRW